MSLPPASHPIWRQIVSGEKSPDFEFLATKIFLGRARLQLARDSSPDTLAVLSDQLRALFEKNSSHPMVLRDAEQLRQEGERR